MPYAYVPPEVYMEYKGVTVWRVYREGTDEPWDYWFTTDEDTADESHSHGSHGHFDARILAGRWPTTPNVQAWEDFWKPRWSKEDHAIDALIMAAIDEGRLPHKVREVA